MGIFNLFKKKETPKPEPVQPIAPQPTITEKWIEKRAYVKIDDSALADLLENVTRAENDDYDLKKKELIEDFEGEKVFRYLPCYVDFRLDGVNVIVKDDYNNEHQIGTIGEAQAKAIGKSIEGRHIPSCIILGGKYKRVYDDDVDVDENLISLTIEYWVKQKKKA